MKHAAESENDIKEGEISVFVVAKILRWDIVNSIEHFVESRLVYKTK